MASLEELGASNPEDEMDCVNEVLVPACCAAVPALRNCVAKEEIMLQKKKSRVLLTRAWGCSCAVLRIFRQVYSTARPARRLKTAYGMPQWSRR